MPLNKDGSVSTILHGSTKEVQAGYKMEEMREELRQIGNRLSMLEGQVRTKTDPALMQPNFSALFNWHLSLMESFYALVWIFYGTAKKDETIQDFQRRFASGLNSK